MALVISDVDGILRAGKGEVDKKLVCTIEEFCGSENELWLVTGAPVSHLPAVCFHRGFGEFGTIEVTSRGDQHVLYPEVRSVFQTMRRALGLCCEDGLDNLQGTIPVIIEGPRECSLTLLFGNPPHYPELGTSWTEGIAEMAKRRVREVAARECLSVRIQVGTDTTYGWLDIKAVTKAEVMFERLPEGEKIFCADDTDLSLLEMPGVIPVGFANSTEKIRVFAQTHGLFYNRPAPQGGMIQFLEDIQKGRV
jgi:hypothetical protein